MDIIKERLYREYDLDTIFTIPTVVYLVKSKQLNIDSIKTGKNIADLFTSGLYLQLCTILGIPKEEYIHLSEGQFIEKYSEQLRPRLVVTS
jgi:hypothetical protein